ncbi:hypothetical protein WV31_09395 [Magnetospirillum sp. ME-1]|uniref:hypothetical protein n=1 Tax=Magnetospirillum sp. ME-1 TaxID=1639348 RepID=UPI000A17D690|nr:hypothetical protein [Magnetospirillum sp. ME-1]ARJ65859.1 hypothetical protein WV31_09395 [Magnetospirillum sp. ME-1]
MVVLIYFSSCVAGLLAVAFVGLAFMDPSTISDMARSIAGRSVAVTYSASRHQNMFASYLVFAGLLTACSFLMIAMKKSIMRAHAIIMADILLMMEDVKRSWRTNFRVDVITLSLFILFIMAAVVRLRYINADMTYDEADIFFMGMDPLFLSLTSLRTSLHNLPILATSASMALFGSAEWAVRLPYLIFGLALVPAVFWCGAVQFDRLTGLIAAAIATIAWPLVAYSVAARGYISGTFAFVLTLAVIPYLVRTGNRGALLTVALLSILAGFSVQSMVFGYVAAMVFLAICILGSGDGRKWRRLLTWPAMISAMTVLGLMVLMSPLLLMHGVKGLSTGDHLVGQVGIGAWDLLRGQIVQVSSEWGLDIPAPLAMMLALGLAVGLCVERTARSLCLSLLIGVSPVFVLVGQQLPPSRIWQFLLPLCAMMSGAGLVWLGRRIPVPSGARPAAAAIILVATGWVFLSVMESGNVITEFAGREPRKDTDEARAFSRELADGDYVSRQVLGNPIHRYYVYRGFLGRDLMFTDDRTYIRVCSRSKGCGRGVDSAYYFSAKFSEPPPSLLIQPGSVHETGYFLRAEQPVLKGRLVPRPTGNSIP